MPASTSCRSRYWINKSIRPPPYKEITHNLPQGANRLRYPCCSIRIISWFRKHVNLFCKKLSPVPKNRSVKDVCLKTLDEPTVSVLKYLQSNEICRCGGKSTVFCPGREAPLAVKGRSGRGREGAPAAPLFKRKARSNVRGVPAVIGAERGGIFPEVKWNRAQSAFIQWYRGAYFFAFPQGIRRKPCFFRG